MFQCNPFQIKLHIQKSLIVNFKIRNLQKFQSIVSFFRVETLQDGGRSLYSVQDPTFFIEKMFRRKIKIKTLLFPNLKNNLGKAVFAR